MRRSETGSQHSKVTTVNRICVHQPDFAPYLGFFHRLLYTDTFIYLDDVQFLRRGWHHRDKIKSRHGVDAWLSLSVSKGDFNQTIRDVRLQPGMEWRQKNLNLLKDSYSKAPYFDNFFPKIIKINEKQHKYMIDMNLEIIDFLLSAFGMSVKSVFSSQLSIGSESSQRLLDLVLANSGDVYISGVGARDYLDTSIFRDRGVSVVWQDFHHPVYKQVSEPFLPYMSSLDALFCVGPEVNDLLRSISPIVVD